MIAFNPPDAWFSLITISLLVTFRVVTLFCVVVPRTSKFPLTVTLRNVTGVFVEAPLPVTLARVSDSAVKYPPVLWSPQL